MLKKAREVALDDSFKAGDSYKEAHEATVVVERSNSFNSNIDWIVHGSIEGSRPHVGFVFGYVNSVDREASAHAQSQIFDR